MERFMEQMHEHMNAFYQDVLDFVPHLLVLVIVTVAGALTAALLRLILLRLLHMIKFDNWSDEIGLTSFMHKGRIRKQPTELIGMLVFWTVFLIFFMIGFASMGLKVTNTLVSLFFLYLPRFISAVFILLFGYFFAAFLSRAALLAGVNAGIAYSRLLSDAVRLMILVLVFAMALEQLAIAPRVVFAAFSIFFGSISLALAIAFGLGGREAAKKFIEDLKKKREEDHTEPL